MVDIGTAHCSKTPFSALSSQFTSPSQYCIPADTRVRPQPGTTRLTWCEERCCTTPLPATASNAGGKADTCLHLVSLDSFLQTYSQPRTDVKESTEKAPTV